MVEDIAPESEIGILYPNVEVLRVMSSAGGQIADIADKTGGPEGRLVFITTVPLTLPMLAPIDIRIPIVEIHDAANSMLVGHLA
ncbi:hypothetical protein [Leptolyngbya sp. FACHB-16]|uniref:hypothetical protein n=1 Tax=unclassified Leptolyngbya TaxID=2650499 RepID=UPI001684D3EE|nr:hypothetical protein [Leptolyngbya sp. FACHB-16]MBD2156692.1 hypothetical protein [Leptolyngbya sp. FACHB-16]